MESSWQPRRPWVEADVTVAAVEDACRNATSSQKAGPVLSFALIGQKPGVVHVRWQRSSWLASVAQVDVERDEFHPIGFENGPCWSSQQRPAAFFEMQLMATILWHRQAAKTTRELRSIVQMASKWETEKYHKCGCMSPSISATIATMFSREWRCAQIDAKLSLKGTYFRGVIASVHCSALCGPADRLEEEDPSRLAAARYP